MCYVTMSLISIVLFNFMFELKCAESVNVPYETLFNCTTGQKGIELQLKDEQQTHRIARPYPSFIPTIVYNGVCTHE